MVQGQLLMGYPSMARNHAEIGFWDYARYGIPVTLLTSAAGLALLLMLPG
jgi:Na+/H+ antiporter NhaD/arsenite permease-like protein